jgi:hypothetical protein
VIADALLHVPWALFGLWLLLRGEGLARDWLRIRDKEAEAARELARAAFISAERGGR